MGNKGSNRKIKYKSEVRIHILYIILAMTLIFATIVLMYYWMLNRKTLGLKEQVAILSSIPCTGFFIYLAYKLEKKYRK